MTQITPDEFNVRSILAGQLLKSFSIGPLLMVQLISSIRVVPPVGPGLWVPTPPAFGAPVGPHWGNNRLFVKGSLNGTEPPPQPVYPVDPGSDYYKMEKEVYDVSQTLTADQISYRIILERRTRIWQCAFRFILTQVLAQVNPTLDIAALAVHKNRYSD